MALGHIGVSQFVQSPTDGSLQSVVCNQFWDSCVQQVLQDFPWGFATVYAALEALTSSPPPFWAGAFGYPADCLQARLILPTPSVWQGTTPPGYLSSSSPFDFWGCWFHPERQIPFEVFNTGSGIGIATNELSPTLAYTQNMTNLAFWSPAAITALSWLLGSCIVSPLASNPQFGINAGAQYQGALIQAAKLAMNEGKERPAPESELIDVRQ